MWVCGSMSSQKGVLAFCLRLGALEGGRGDDDQVAGQLRVDDVRGARRVQRQQPQQRRPGRQLGLVRACFI